MHEQLYCLKNNEGLILDILDNAKPLIAKATRGDLTDDDLVSWKKSVAKTIPEGSPGKQVTMNANEAGRLLKALNNNVEGETVLNRLEDLSKSSTSYLGELNDLYEEKNQLKIEKNEAENKYNQLLLEYNNLKKKLKTLEEETQRNKKLQDELNQDINELSQETDSLVEEIDKWQT